MAPAAMTTTTKGDGPMKYRTSDGQVFDLDTLNGHRRRTVLALIAAGHLTPIKPPSKKAASTTRKKD